MYQDETALTFHTYLVSIKTKWLRHSPDATSTTLKPKTPGQDTSLVNAIYDLHRGFINRAVVGATADITETLSGPLNVDLNLTHERMLSTFRMSWL